MIRKKACIFWKKIHEILLLIFPFIEWRCSPWIMTTWIMIDIKDQKGKIYFLIY